MIKYLLLWSLFFGACNAQKTSDRQLAVDKGEKDFFVDGLRVQFGKPIDTFDSINFGIFKTSVPALNCPEYEIWQIYDSSRKCKIHYTFFEDTLSGVKLDFDTLVNPTLILGSDTILFDVVGGSSSQEVDGFVIQLSVDSADMIASGNRLIVRAHYGGLALECMR